jgi:hypothetical protein
VSNDDMETYIYHTWHMENGIIHLMREAEGNLYSFRMYLCLYY